MSEQRGTRTEVIVSVNHGPGEEGISRTARQVVIIIEGTSRGDGTAEILRANGWR